MLSALQRAGLLPPSGTTDKVAEEKFRLDALVNEEGKLSWRRCLSLADRPV